MKCSICTQAQKKECPCTYVGCERHGKCCECVQHHRAKGQLPAYYFSPEEEKTYDRSIDFYNTCNKK